MDEPFDGYDDLTVDEAKTEIDERDPGYEELRAIHGYEYENKDRVTLKRWIKDRADEIEASEPEPPVEVTVAPSGRRQYVAGIWFDHYRDQTTVELDGRVRRAINNDLLRVVEEHR